MKHAFLSLQAGDPVAEDQKSVMGWHLNNLVESKFGNLWDASLLAICSHRQSQ